MFAVLEKDRHSFHSIHHEKHSMKRRSSGFLKSLVSDSKEALLAPFQTKQKKSPSETNLKEKGTQTKLTDICQFNRTLGSSSAAFFNQHYPVLAQRRRRYSRARSDPSTRSLMNLSSDQSGNNSYTHSPSQSFTLPARLEPSLLSPDWHSTSVSLRRTPSSALSAASGTPVFSQRINSLSSCSSDHDEKPSVWHIVIDPVVEELLKYPWGKDSLWLMAFVFFASSLVLLGYIITTVIPTLVIAVIIAVVKSLIFNRTETIAHLKLLLHSARTSVFTQEFVLSLKASSFEVVTRVLRLVLPPALAKA